MKRIFTLLMLSLAVVACNKDKYEYPSGDKQGFGTLSFANLYVGVDESVEEIGTRAAGTISDADDTYNITVTGSDGTVYFDDSYGKAKLSGGISLPESKDGQTYTLTARSTKAEVPATGWDNPVYGATVKDIAVTAGEETSITEIVCALLQHKVTVDYNDDFKAMVRGNSTTKVTYNNDSGSELSFALNYDAATKRVTREERAGYFNVVEGGTTLEVTFSGKMDLNGNGEEKVYRMTKAFTDVTAQSWRHITFIKKVDEEGNATFDIQINDYVEDLPLEEITNAEESTLGTDPNAPIGDGGIELISTCAYDITQPITIPASSTPLVLTMDAVVPNGVRTFTVDISSDNADFMGALDVVGGAHVDLVNPSDLAMGIFDIVPFPHGAELAGMTVVPFDLSAAQTSILAFKGTHTFKMNVQDKKGCKKEVIVVMHVPTY
ncbi:MAG: DUF4493 domain-containing protein [Alistipes sp.]|nr:DUF4493 domain-containing protein [Alistipes sp.]